MELSAGAHRHYRTQGGLEKPTIRRSARVGGSYSLLPDLRELDKYLCRIALTLLSDWPGWISLVCAVSIGQADLACSLRWRRIGMRCWVANTLAAWRLIQARLRYYSLTGLAVFVTDAGGFLAVLCPLAGTGVVVANLVPYLAGRGRAYWAAGEFVRSGDHPHAAAGGGVSRGGSGVGAVAR